MSIAGKLWTVVIYVSNQFLKGWLKHQPGLLIALYWNLLMKPSYVNSALENVMTLSKEFLYQDRFSHISS
jgi:hypothetical protein